MGRVLLTPRGKSPLHEYQNVRDLTASKLLRNHLHNGSILWDHISYGNDGYVADSLVSAKHISDILVSYVLFRNREYGPCWISRPRARIPSTVDGGIGHLGHLVTTAEGSRADYRCAEGDQTNRDLSHAAIIAGNPGIGIGYSVSRDECPPAQRRTRCDTRSDQSRRHSEPPATALLGGSAFSVP